VERGSDGFTAVGGIAFVWGVYFFLLKVEEESSSSLKKLTIPCRRYTPAKTTTQIKIQSNIEVSVVYHKTIPAGAGVCLIGVQAHTFEVRDFVRP